MKNTKGQMHVLEVLLVATLFTSTINVAVNILPTSDANNVDEYDLYFTGLEILEVLDDWVPSDSDVAVAHHDRTVPDGSVSQTFRLVWADDELWELNLQLWYGYRES